MDITSDEKRKLKEFEKKLGYKFKRRVHLKRALMHKSFANENRYPHTDHNERYEFLGDAVLELAISSILIEKFSDQPEGELSKFRAAVVNEARLAELAREIGLGDYLYLGKGEDQTGGRDKPSLLSDAFEAVLGAVFIDRGYKKAYDVVRRHFMEALDETGGVGFVKDYKTRLQEVSQGRFKAIPRYKMVGEEGPDHSKTFEVNIIINNEVYGVGTGSSKKSAEQQAAKQALEKLKGQ
jgi:ribonuclease III